MAYYRLEPFGEIVADQRHGIASALLANVNRDAKRVPEAYKPADFLPWHQQKAAELGGELLVDLEAQSALIKQRMFKHQ